jgi:hypothetical protein
MNSLKPIRLMFPLLLPALVGAAEPLFKPQVIDANVGIGYGLAAADVDGDGKTDLLLADKGRIVWYANPSWTPHVIAEKLTAKDHVCLAARDIDGDGKCEIAVGAEWNPGDTVGSGAVFYLMPPADRTQKWEAIRLPHEPTTHRMRWVRGLGGAYSLVVVPLHGRGNVNGAGAGVKILAYSRPADPRQAWPTTVLLDSLHLTHNLDVIPAAQGAAESVLVCAREGIVRLNPGEAGWSEEWIARHDQDLKGAGEVRHGLDASGRLVVATIEPMHGNQVCLYEPTVGGPWVRRVLDTTLVDGHALALGSFGGGALEVVAGWRSMSKPAGPVGIRRYDPARPESSMTVDDNTMACEDLVSVDLDGDGDLDLAASGRRTRNLIVYWNQTR